MCARALRQERGRKRRKIYFCPFIVAPERNPFSFQNNCNSFYSTRESAFSEFRPLSSSIETSLTPGKKTKDWREREREREKYHALKPRFLPSRYDKAFGVKLDRPRSFPLSNTQGSFGCYKGNVIKFTIPSLEKGRRK